MKHIRTRVLGTAVLTAVGLVGTIGGISYAAGSHGSTSATHSATSGTSSTGKPVHHRKGGLLGRAEYGQVVVRRHKADVTLDVQRGTLTAVDVSGNTGSITVRSVDGHTQTYQLAATSKVRTKGAPVALSTLATGERVGVLAKVSGSTATVTRMAVRPAAAAHPATGSASPSTAPSASSGA